MNLADLMIPSDAIDFAQYFKDSEAHTKVLPATAFLDEVLVDLDPSTKANYPKMPWAKVHSLFAYRPGEVTLYGGSNGTWKSFITGQIAQSLAAQGERCCIASFEMKPRKTLGRMLKQVARGSSPATQFARKYIDWLGGRLWLYDQQGTVRADVLYGVMKWAANELGVGHFFIDSLMKCVRNEDDYNEQKIFVDTLCAIARDLNVHAHLVHHVKKLADDYDVPQKKDIKGTGAITDQVDNVVLVWRNKKKERAIESGEDVDLMEPDVLLIVDKQRNGEWEGRIGLWRHSDSMQFVQTVDRLPMDLMVSPDGEVAEGF
jgi:twinkle protein